MPKGATSKFRPGGNSRLGVRDVDPKLREKLQFLSENPQELAALPAAERERCETQIASMEAQSRMRSAATKRGHENRRPRKLAKQDRYMADTQADVDAVVTFVREQIDFDSAAMQADVLGRALGVLVAECADESATSSEMRCAVIELHLDELKFHALDHAAKTGQLTRKFEQMRRRLKRELDRTYAHAGSDGD